jgi:hypothetical protein
MATDRSESISVFLTNPEPPASNEAVTNSISALKKTIAARQAEPRRRLATSIPFNPGIEMSNTTTSGVVLSKAAIADFPSGAVPTISWFGFSISAEYARISGMYQRARLLGISKQVLNYGAISYYEKVQRTLRLPWIGKRSRREEVDGV